MAGAQDFVDNPTPESAAPPPGGFNEVPQQAPANFALRDTTKAQRFFKDPDLMMEAAQIFLKNGLPEGVKWIERGHQAAQENLFEAMGHLEAGDGEAAVSSFNKSGRFRDAKAATKNADGTWTIERTSGDPVTINPEAVRKSLLSPKEYFAERRAEQEQKLRQDENARKAKVDQEELKLKTRQLDQLGEYQRGTLAQKGEHDRMLLEKQQTGFAHALEVAGVRAESARAIAELKDANSPAAVRKAIVGDLLKNVTPGDAAATAQVNAMADQLTRGGFVDVHKNPDGEGFVVVDKMGGKGQYRALGVFPDMETATKAKIAYIGGQNLPGAPAAKPGAAPRADAPPRVGPKPGSFEAYSRGAVRRQLPPVSTPDEEPTDPLLRTLGGYQ